MNLVRCPNGHFYDELRYSECPHCAGGAAADVTVPVNRNEELDVTVPAGNTSSLHDAVKTAVGSTDDGKTVGVYRKAMGTEPVVGWLVCIDGEHFGEDFRLKSGRNFIGRGTGMDVVISKDSAVSRDKHAIVVYEPKANQFLVMPGESKELCYLNDEVVLTAREISMNEILTVGETKLMFIPCCSKAFTWDSAKKAGGN